MGLLGYDDQDVTQGLLSFGQLASQKRPFLGLLAGLAAADRSQAGRQELLRQRDVEERKLKLEEALKQAQIGEYNAQAAQRQAEADKLRQAQAEAQRIQSIIGGALSPIRGIEANAQSGIVGPRPEALDVVGQRKPLDFQSLYAQGVPAARLEELAKLPTLGMPTVARTLERDDGKGGKETIQLDAQGRIVGQGIPAYIAPVQVNQGDRMTFTRPTAGVSLPINMSLAERDASARGWTSIADARKKEAGDKWQFDPQRGVQINPLTGEWRPVTSADGKPLEAKGTSSEQAANAAATAYKTIDSMLKHPGLDTAIGLSGQIDPRNYVWGTQAQGARALIEQAQGQAFLQAFESLRGGGQITQIEGEKATAAIARLQRAQNESDFKAAAKELQDIAASAYQRASGKPLQIQPSGIPSADAIAAELERRRRAGTTGGW